MTEHAPLRVLVLDTVMDRGGAETMMMNYRAISTVAKLPTIFW